MYIERTDDRDMHVRVHKLSSRGYEVILKDYVKMVDMKIYRKEQDMHEVRVEDVLRNDVENALHQGEDAIHILEEKFGIDVNREEMKNIEDFINRIIENLRKEGLEISNKDENYIRELYKMIAYIINRKLE